MELYILGLHGLAHQYNKNLETCTIFYNVAFGRTIQGMNTVLRVEDATLYLTALMAKI